MTSNTPTIDQTLRQRDITTARKQASIPVTHADRRVYSEYPWNSSILKVLEVRVITCSLILALHTFTNCFLQLVAWKHSSATVNVFEGDCSTVLAVKPLYHYVRIDALLNLDSFRSSVLPELGIAFHSGNGHQPLITEKLCEQENFPDVACTLSRLKHKLTSASFLSFASPNKGFIACLSISLVMPVTPKAELAKDQIASQLATR